MAEQPETRRGAISFTPLAEIAMGATARVDLCRAADGRLLAVKRLHPHVAEDPGFATQFLDEVWMTASLKHPNVVEVAGWGTDRTGSYLAVELVPGVSLARLMKTVFETGEQFNERMVVHIAAKIAAGLSAAHHLRSPEGEFLNLVHRDLTPGNILVGFDGDVKIADFGLAKAKLRLTKTMTGLAKGQPTYMAPEQAKALEIDSRADLFSLGIVLFELFAGRRPWVAGSDYDMVQRTATDPPADLRELRPKIDKELVNIVNRCLEKTPQARFQSAEEVQARLDEWLHVHGYNEGGQEALARFVRRNAMRQMRWFERAVAGEFAPEPVAQPQRIGRQLPPRTPSYPSASAPAGYAQQQQQQRPPPPVSPAAGSRPEDRRISGGQPFPAPPSQPFPLRETRRNGEPVIRHVSDSNEWAEEVPTLVQKEGPGATPTSKALGKRQPNHDLPTIDDDESDSLKTTSVKQTRGQRYGAPLPNAIADADSEELPTLPVAHGQQPGRPGPRRAPSQAPPLRPRTEPPPAPRQQQQDAARRQPSTAPPPPLRPYVAGPNTVTRGPRPLNERGRPGSAPPPRPGSAPPPAMDQGQNGGGALARNAVEAVRAAVFAATAEQARVSLHSQTVDELAPSPGRRSVTEAPPASDIRPSSMTQTPSNGGVPSRPTNTEMLFAEADRLAIEAVRRSEEAKAAQIRAERKSTQAKLAGEAALVAAEATRLAQSLGFAAGLARLDEAYVLEQQMHAGVSNQNPFGLSRPGSSPGPQPSVPPSALSHGAQQPHSSYQQQQQPQQQQPMMPPPMQQPPPQQQQAQQQPPQPGYGMPSPAPSQLQSGGYSNALSQRIGFADNNQLASGEVARLSFAPPAMTPVARLRAFITTTPPALIAGVAVGGFIFMFLLLWLIFG